jgi:exodeoxyribonuclease VIII
MPNSDYHSSGAISKSGLDKLAQSPAHLWYYQQQGCESTKAMDFVSLFHDLVLMGSDFVSKFYKVMPDFYLRSQSGRDEKTTWLAMLASWQTPVTKDDWEMCIAMRDSVMMHPYAKWLIEQAQKEMACENSHFWCDDETFAYCRVRPDIKLLSHGILGDLKTTADCTPREFSKSIADYRYHVQDAMYRDGVFQTEGFEINDFWFIATEKTAEKPVTVAYRLDEVARTKGLELYRRDLNLYAELMEQDDFMKPAEISMPIWATK